jgi:sugar phosphate isomerase/epimerase
MHATAEGGYSWPLGLELLAPWIKTVDIKDFKWLEAVPGEWEIQITPLGQGMVDFGKFMKEISRLDIRPAFSLHYEYGLGGAEHGSVTPDMEPGEIYRKIKRDMVFFKAVSHIQRSEETEKR